MKWGLHGSSTNFLVFLVWKWHIVVHFSNQHMHVTADRKHTKRATVLDIRAMGASAPVASPCYAMDDCQLTTIAPTAAEFDRPTSLRARFHELVQVSAIDLSLLLNRVSGTHLSTYVVQNLSLWSSASYLKTALS